MAAGQWSLLGFDFSKSRHHWPLTDGHDRMVIVVEQHRIWRPWSTTEHFEIFVKLFEERGHYFESFWNGRKSVVHGEYFMAIFTTLSVVIWFSTCTLGIFATLVYVFTMRVVIYDILSMEIIPTLSTSILFCNLCYILLWILPHSVVKIAIRI